MWGLVFSNRMKGDLCQSLEFFLCISILSGTLPWNSCHFSHSELWSLSSQLSESVVPCLSSPSLHCNIESAFRQKTWEVIWLLISLFFKCDPMAIYHGNLSWPKAELVLGFKKPLILLLKLYLTRLKPIVGHAIKKWKSCWNLPVNLLAERRNMPWQQREEADFLKYLNNYFQIQ